MARFFQPFYDCNFAKGVVEYTDNYPGDKDNNRIVIPIKVIEENNPPITAIIDTGTPFCVIDPEIIEIYRDHFSEIDTATFIIRGERIRGIVGRLPLLLSAQTGDSIEIEATVFCPELDGTNSWPYPNFIGLNGFLDRIRFALDPLEKNFYFAANI